jgi:hypothetical protein
MVYGLWFVVCGSGFNECLKSASRANSLKSSRQSWFLYLSSAKNAIGILIFQAASFYSAELIIQASLENIRKNP